MIIVSNQGMLFATVSFSKCVELCSVLSFSSQRRHRQELQAFLPTSAASRGALLSPYRDQVTHLTVVTVAAVFVVVIDVVVVVVVVVVFAAVVVVVGVVVGVVRFVGIAAVMLLFCCKGGCFAAALL